MDVKELTTHLLKQEFDDYLLEVKYWGPYEEEDICADVVLKEKPADWVDRSYRIYSKLLDEGFDVLIGYDVLDGSDEL